ncbi:MAG: M81 family metallopeptidase [Rhizobiales bacterium]|nr:M81 family metallopeptidase [Hyphomicrobiales bacterium]
MRVLLAGLFHETHCFVPATTGLADFRIERDAELFARRGDGSQVDGFLAVADREGWEVVPACSYTATPSGRVEDAVIAAFFADLIPRAERAARDGIDAVYLSLHGAMVSQSLDDVEGELLRRLRAVPGLGTVPLFGVFDLHANLSEAMTRHADGLVCYRENPHVDARDAAVRAAELLARCLATGERPRMVRRSVPIVWPPTGTGTADLPMRDLEALARAIEAADPAIWAVNVVAGFSFADVADAGVGFSVVTVGKDGAAEAALDRLEACALALREHGLVADMDIDVALDQAAAFAGRGPVLLVEPSDNIGGGAPGNGTGILRALVRRDAAGAGVIINDPHAVAALSDVPAGGRARIALGGRDNPLDHGPVTLEVVVVSRSDGRFDLEDVNSHLVASQGRHIDMGPSVVVRHRGITILLTTLRTPPNDLGQWRSQGVNPEALSLIAIKAGVAHRRAYDPIAAASFNVATPGPCASDPAALPYTRIRRPIFPLDR